MKIKRIIAFVFASSIVLVLGYFYVSFNGNPISSWLASHNAKEYIVETYPDTDYQIENTFYNFKFGTYEVRIESEKNIDEHFTLTYNWTGKLERDGYEDEVKNGMNTQFRLDEAYRILMKATLESDDFPIDFDDERNNGFGTLEFVRKPFTFILNKEYDMKELGKEYGFLWINIYQDEFSTSDIMESLRKIKSYMDDHEIAFHYIDLQYFSENKYKGVSLFEYEDIGSSDFERKVNERLQEGAIK